MSNFSTTTEVDLDAEWVSDLLITAFDGQYGGSWYWVNEDDDIESVKVLTNGDEWRGVTFWFAKHVRFGVTVPRVDNTWIPEPHLGDRGDGKTRWHLTLEKQHLDKAWATIVNDRPIGRDFVEQFTRSMHENDLDVDAIGADCLVQIALFGEVVYG